jgi:hypothetical protein
MMIIENMLAYHLPNAELGIYPDAGQGFLALTAEAAELERGAGMQLDAALVATLLAGPIR